MGRRRRATRLDGFDYASEGAYFVTICTWRRVRQLARIADGVVDLNDDGKIVKAAWLDLPRYYPRIFLDEFVLMPNHVHGILFLDDGAALGEIGAGLRPAPSLPRKVRLGQVVGSFKSFSSRRINGLHGSSGERAWRRGYCETVVRTKGHLTKLRRYVLGNPETWALDRLSKDTRAI
jgi:REP element-mobilizing transposase RayT